MTVLLKVKLSPWVLLFGISDLFKNGKFPVFQNKTGNQRWRRDARGQIVIQTWVVTTHKEQVVRAHACSGPKLVKIADPQESLSVSLYVVLWACIRNRQ